jgi:hypothetical protein
MYVNGDAVVRPGAGQQGTPVSFILLPKLSLIRMGSKDGILNQSFYFQNHLFSRTVSVIWL